jgi:hypothetical protein
MSNPETHRSDTPPRESSIEAPRGTLAIMVIFGLLFLLTWLATYFFLFLERGAPHH